MPFTRSEFFAVFAAYNTAVWPIQWAAYILGLAVALAAWRGTATTTRQVAAGLSVLWASAGIGYHVLHFAAVNRAAYGFGALFAGQALLLLAIAVRPFAWSRAAGARRWLGALVVLYALVIYPLLGLALGHGWPAMPSFGITPCPLTIFTLGVLLLAGNAPAWSFVVPLLWSAVGGSAAWLLGVPEDLGLLAAGAAAAAMLLVQARQRRSAG